MTLFLLCLYAMIIFINITIQYSLTIQMIVFILNTIFGIYLIYRFAKESCTSRNKFGYTVSTLGISTLIISAILILTPIMKWLPKVVTVLLLISVIIIGIGIISILSYDFKNREEEE